MKNKSFAKTFVELVCLAGTAALFTACTGGGGVSGGAGTGTTGTGTVTTTAVFPTTSGSGWTPIVSGGRYFIKGLKLSIDGTCSLGIATVQVFDGTTTTTTPCSSGTYAWSYVYGVDPGGNETITITGLNSLNQAVSGGVLTVLVWVGNTAPGSLVVTAPAGSTNGSTFVDGATTNTYTITGTCTTDTDHLLLNGSTTVPVVNSGSCTWTDTVDLFGGTSAFSFVAVNLAGNQSAAYVQKISWASPVYLGGAFSGGSVTSHDTVHIMEATMSYQQGSENTHLLTGFNYILNAERANP